MAEFYKRRASMRQSVFIQERTGVRGKEALYIVGVKGMRDAKASLHL